MDNKQVAEKIYKNLITGEAFEQVDNDYMEYIFKSGNIQRDSTMDKLVKDIILYSVSITREYENPNEWLIGFQLSVNKNNQQCKDCGKMF